MKIAEAMVKRSDLKKRINRAASRVSNTAIIAAGDDGSDHKAALAEWHSINNQIEQLSIKLMAANQKAKLENGMTISTALAKRDSLTRLVEFIESIRVSVPSRDSGYASVYNVKAARLLLDQTTKERSELDMMLQKANWSNELE